jgi:hypothetical protein
MLRYLGLFGLYIITLAFAAWMVFSAIASVIAVGMWLYQDPDLPLWLTINSIVFLIVVFFLGFCKFVESYEDA